MYSVLLYMVLFLMNNINLFNYIKKIKKHSKYILREVTANINKIPNLKYKK